MLHTTRAIVLRTIRHGERTVILKAYTEQFGLRSYVVRAGGRSGVQQALLQPLSRLELVADERSDRDLHTVKEARSEMPGAPMGHPGKAAAALFTQEVLLRVLKEEAADQDLFLFAHSAIETIDREDDLSHFPLSFLTGLMRHLGFQPSLPEHGEENFDLLEGQFVHGDAPSGHTLRAPLSTGLAALLEPFREVPLRFPAAERRELLDHLLLFYRLHVEGFGELRSIDVLREVLS